MVEKKITLILLGDIAAGKGTQAEFLVKKFKLKLISTGAFTRKYWTGTSKIHKRLARTKLGKLTPSDIIQKFLKRTLERLPKSRGVLIDGGKMPAEARLIYKIFHRQARKVLVVYIQIPKAEIFRRLRYRYYCARTGQPLVIKDGATKCPHCGGEIIKRADDDPKAIKNRIAYYDEIYSKTVKFWQGKKLLKKIDGRGRVEKVTKMIVNAINNHYGFN